MQSLCTNCLKDDALRDLVEIQGRSVDLCQVCGASHVKSLGSDCGELKSRVRALIRFHFSEWHYNPHLGGDGLEALFFNKNPITNYCDTWDKEKYEEAVLEFLDPPYEEYDEGISLFAGYTDGYQNPPLVALNNDECPTVARLKKLSEEKNHFLIEGSVSAALTRRLPDIEGTMPLGSRLYRTRIGYDARATPLMGWGDERHYRPYAASRLSSPPPVVASAGRLNRQGVAYLYLATDAHTAIAETRPHPGHFCSYAEFEASKELRLADLSSIRVTRFASSDKRLDDFLLLKTLDNLFSMPITPEGRSGYHFSQLLADCFRQLGFDAICYNSSVGPGTNYAVFEPENFSFVEGSAQVVKIAGLSYSYDTMCLMGDEGDYMTKPDGSFW